MWRRRGAIGFIALAVGILLACQAANNSGTSSASIPDGEVLYVVDNGNVTTYAIDPTSLAPTVTESPVELLPASSSLLQFVPSPDDHSVYALWMDQQQREHLSTYSTDAAGVPLLPALQTLDVSSLSQWNVHPSGRFAYAMQLENGNGPFTSTIFLFHIDSSGMLQDKGQVLGKYGPAILPTLLYGLNPVGSELYLGSQQQDGPVFWERSVNKKSGLLARQVLLLRPPLQDSTVFGAKVIIDYNNASNTAPPRHVTILPNTPNPREHLIQCGSAMLSACGNATNVQIDPSGEYLFLTDSLAQQVRVAGIHLDRHELLDTGSFLPSTAQTPGFVFSPDGKVVYAVLASDLSLHIYVFDRSDGTLTESSATIPISDSAGFVAALHR